MGRELVTLSSVQREGDDAAGPPAPRRRGAGGGQRKGKNRDAARKSRMKQTAKADELHKVRLWMVLINGVEVSKNNNKYIHSSMVLVALI